jgi:hypothetical protein
MPRTIAELRKFNRERRAAQRAAAREAGIPPADRVAAAIAEATAFAMRSGGVNIGDDGEQHLQIDAATVITAAVDILTRRAGFDMKHSRAAVARIVAPRPEHVWPGYVPSHTKAAHSVGRSA